MVLVVLLIGQFFYWGIFHRLTLPLVLKFQLQWRRICEWPAFWAKMRLSVKPKNLQRMPQVKISLSSSTPNTKISLSSSTSTSSKIILRFQQEPVLYDLQQVLAVPRLEALKRLRICQVRKYSLSNKLICSEQKHPKNCERCPGHYLSTSVY